MVLHELYHLPEGSRRKSTVGEDHRGHGRRKKVQPVVILNARLEGAQNVQLAEPEYGRFQRLAVFIMAA